MKNLTVALDDDVHRKLRVRAAEAGVSMSRYVTTLMERDLESEALLDEEKRRRQREALQRLLDAPKLEISENGRMPDADERHARG